MRYMSSRRMPTDPTARRERVEPAVRGAQRKRLRSKVDEAVELLTALGFEVVEPDDLEARIRTRVDQGRPNGTA